MTSTYRIDTERSDEIAAGIESLSAARRRAQDVADRTGRSVILAMDVACESDHARLPCMECGAITIRPRAACEGER